MIGCPVKDKDWLKMVDVVGVNYAYNIHNRNGRSIDTETMKEAKLYKDLVAHYGESEGEKLYYLTHTSNFQDTFGNWVKASEELQSFKEGKTEDEIKDMRHDLILKHNLSTVVDDNLNPLTVYRHSFAKNISEFVEDSGIHFTNDKDIAETVYNGDNTYAGFLNSKDTTQVAIEMVDENRHLLDHDKSYIAVNNRDIHQIHNEYVVFHKGQVFNPEYTTGKPMFGNVEVYNNYLAKGLNTYEEEATAINIIAGNIGKLIETIGNKNLKDVKDARRLNEVNTTDIKQAVANIFKELSEHPKLSSLQKDFHSRVFQAIQESNPADKDYYKSIWNKAKNELYKTYKISVIDLDEVEYDTTQLEETETRRTEFNDWKRDQISTTDKVLPMIKRTILTIPLLTSSNYLKDGKGNYIYNEKQSIISGTRMFMNYDYTIAWLKNKLVNAINPQHLLAIMNRQAVANPSIIQLVHKLQSDSQLLSAFYTQFSQSNVSERWLKVNNKEGILEFSSADSFKQPHELVANEWYGNTRTYMDSHPEDNSIAKRVSERNKEYATTDNVKNLVPTITKLANDIGIYLSEEALTGYIADLNHIYKGTKDVVKLNVYQNVILPLKYIADMIQKENVYESKEIDGTDDVTEDEPATKDVNALGRFNQLAKIHTDYSMSDTDLTYTTVDNQAKYAIKNSSFISDWFKKLTTTDETTSKNNSLLFQELSKLPITRFSNLWTNIDGTLRQDTNTGNVNLNSVRNISIWENGGVKSIDTALGTTYRDTNNEDWTLTNYLHYLDGINTNKAIIPSLILADSSKNYLFGFDRISLGVGEYDADGLSRDSELYKRMFNVFLQEIDKIQQCKKDVLSTNEEGKTVTKDNLAGLQKYYHFKEYDKDGKPVIFDKDGKPTGKGFQFTHYPEFNKSSLFLQGILDDKYTSENILKVRDSGKTNAILEDIHNTINKTAASLYAGMYNRVLKYKENLQEKHIPEGFNHSVIEYALNSFIYNVEQQNLWFGNTSEYKSPEDFIKRAKQITAPGLAISGIHTGHNMRVGVINDVVRKSGLYNEMSQKLEDLKIPEGIRENILGAYKKINTTDAQGFITVSAAVRWHQDLGTFANIANLVEPYTKSTENGDITNYKIKEGLAYEDYKGVFEPIKPFYYNRTISPDFNRLMSTQYKLHLTPLIPEMFGTNSQMNDIIKHMEKTNMDMLVFESAEKDGTTYLTRVANTDGGLESNKLDDIYIKETDISKWRIQQDVPEHIEDEVNKFGIQITKIILNNIDRAGSYDHNGKNFTGDELARHYLKTISEIVKRKAEDLNRRLGDFGDARNIHDILYREAIDRGFSDGEIAGLQLKPYIDSEGNTKYTFNVPLFFSAYVNKWMSILTSQFTNNVAAWKIPGLHAVLVSNVFSKANGGIELSNELKSYFDGDKLVFECAVPAWSKSMYRDGQLVDVNDIPDNLKEMLGFRIPTSGKHSAVILKVVRFLPKTSGSVIMLPMDVVTRMGSDFDVDSLFVNYPQFYQTGKGEFKKIEYSTSNNKIHDRYIQYINSRADKLTRDEEGLNQYMELQSEKAQAYSDMMKTVQSERDRLNQQLEYQYDAGKKLFRTLPQDIKDIYWSNEDKLKLSTDNGIEKQVFYRDLTLQLISQLESVKNDESFENPEAFEAIPTLQDMVHNYEQILRYRGIGKESLDTVYKEALTQFRTDKEAVYADMKDIPLAVAMVVASQFNLTQLDEFVKKSEYEQNGDKAIQNEYLDILKTILGNKSSLAEGIRPVGYQESVDSAEYYRKLTGMNISNLNPVFPHHQEMMRERALDGKNLIAIFASNNTGLSVLAHCKATLDKGLVIRREYTFDKLKTKNNNLTNLSNKDVVKYLETKYGKDNVSSSDKTVTINYENLWWTKDGKNKNIWDDNTVDFAMAQILDHSSDAVKEPLPNNLTPFTANMYVAGLIDGDLNWMNGFINQPVVLDIAKTFSGKNSVVFKENRSEIYSVKNRYQKELFTLLYSDTQDKDLLKILKRVEKDSYSFKEVENEKLFGVTPGANYTFTNEELDRMITQYRKYKSLSKEDKIEFQRNQLMLVESYINLSDSAKAISDNINYLRFDKLGVSPNFDETIKVLANMRNEVYTELGDEKNPRVIVNGTHAVKAIYPSFYDASEESVYPSLETSLNEVNINGMAKISPLFITEQHSFKTALESIVTSVGAYNQDTINYINTKGKSYFLKHMIESPEINKNSESHYIANNEEIQGLILGVDKKIDLNPAMDFHTFSGLSAANQLAVFKLMNTAIPFNARHIINFLSPNIRKEDTTKNGFHAITFRNIKKSGKLDSELQHSLNQMYFNPTTPFERELAKNLVYYNMITYGFANTKNSYGKLVTPEILKDLGITDMLHDYWAIHQVSDNNLNFSIDHEIQTNFIRNNPKIIQTVFNQLVPSEDGNYSKKWGTPYWDSSNEMKKHEIGKDLIIIPNDRANYARIPEGIKNSDYVKVKRGDEYVIYKRYNEFPSEEFDNKDDNIIYYPVNGIGNWNFMESQFNLLVKNNKFLNDEDYTNFIRTSGLLYDETQEEISNDEISSELYTPNTKLESPEVTKTKVDNFTRNFRNAGINVNVIADRSAKTPQISLENGIATIRYNPDRVFGTTIYHEFGHLLVDTLGYDDNYVQGAINELRGSELWNTVKEVWNYKYRNSPDKLNNTEAFEKEVLTTGLGIKLDEIFEKKIKPSKMTFGEKFLFYARMIIYKLRDILNLGDNLEKLSRLLLKGKTRSEVDGSLSDYIQEEILFEPLDNLTGKDKQEKIDKNIANLVKESAKYKVENTTDESGNITGSVYTHVDSKQPLTRTSNFLDAYIQNFDSIKQDAAEASLKAIKNKELFDSLHIITTKDVINFWEWKRQEGVRLHDTLERYVKAKTTQGGIVNENEMNEVSPALKSYVDGLISFYGNGRVLSEVKVGDRRTGIAGTIDLLVFDKDGKALIYDLKTKSRGGFDYFNQDDLFRSYKAPFTNEAFTKSNNYAMQLGMYKYYLSQYGIEVKGMKILPLEADIRLNDKGQYEYYNYSMTDVNGIPVQDLSNRFDDILNKPTTPEQKLERDKIDAKRAIADKALVDQWTKYKQFIGERLKDVTQLLHEYENISDKVELVQKLKYTKKELAKRYENALNDRTLYQTAKALSTSYVHDLRMVDDLSKEVNVLSDKYLGVDLVNLPNKEVIKYAEIVNQVRLFLGTFDIMSNIDYLVDDERFKGNGVADQINNIVKDYNELIVRVNAMKGTYKSLLRKHLRYVIDKYSTNDKMKANLHTIFNEMGELELDDITLTQYMLDGALDASNVMPAITKKLYALELRMAETKIRGKITEYENKSAAYFGKNPTKEEVENKSVKLFDEYGRWLSSVNYDKFEDERENFFATLNDKVEAAVLKTIGKKSKVSETEYNKIYKERRSKIISDWYAGNVEYLYDKHIPELFHTLEPTEKARIIVESMKASFQTEYEFTAWFEKNFTTKGSKIYAKTDGIYARPNDKKYRNDAYYKLKEESPEGYNLLLYLSQELIPELTQNYAGGIAQKGFIPAMGTKIEESESPVDTENVSHIAYDTTNEPTFVLKPKYLSMLNQKSTISFPSREKEESNSEYEMRVMAEIKDAGYVNQFGKKFTTLDEVRQFNRITELENKRIHGESIEKNLDTVIKNFIETSIQYDFRRNVESHLKLQLANARDAKYRKSRGLIARSMDYVTGKVHAKIGETSNTYKQMQKDLEMNFYGKFTKHLDNKNLENFLQKTLMYTAHLYLAGNVFSPVKNLLHHISGNLMEAVGNEYFSMKDWGQSMIDYTKGIPYVGTEDIYTASTSIEQAEMKYMNTFMSQNELIDMNSGNLTKTLTHKTSKVLMHLNHNTEHQIQGQLLFSMMRSHVLADGKIINRDEAIRKAVKEGMSKQDAEEKFSKYPTVKELFSFEPTERSGNKGYAKIKDDIRRANPNIDDEINKFRLKVRMVNRYMNGRYDRENSGAVSNNIIGQIMMMFRKWMRPGWTKRFGTRKEATYNEGLEHMEVGDYKQFWSLITLPFTPHSKTANERWSTEEAKNITDAMGYFEAMYEHLNNMRMYWNNASTSQRASVKRSTVELALAMAIVPLLGAMLRAFRDRDRKLKQNRAINFVIYELDGLNSELLVYTPFYGWWNEGSKMIANPAASWSIGTRVLSVVKDLVQLGWYYDTPKARKKLYKQSGNYKGQLKLKTDLLELTPLVNQYRRWNNLNHDVEYYRLIHY